MFGGSKKSDRWQDLYGCPICKLKDPAAEGCPAWHEVVVETSEGGTEVWKGCCLGMFVKLLLGVAKGANRAAMSVQSARNVIAASIERAVALAGVPGSYLREGIAEADAATAAGRDLLEGAVEEEGAVESKKGGDS